MGVGIYMSDLLYRLMLEVRSYRVLKAPCFVYILRYLILLKSGRQLPQIRGRSLNFVNILYKSEDENSCRILSNS